MVHLRKTAGSSITCLLHPSIHRSGKGDSRCDANASDHYRPSALANAVTKRIHLVPALVDAHDDFLVTMRHPVTRIVS